MTSAKTAAKAGPLYSFIVVLIFTSITSAALQPLTGISGQTLPDYVKGKFIVFILTGNSNCEGVLCPSSDEKTAHPRLIEYKLNSGWVPKVSSGKTGMGIHFGKYYADAHPDMYVGIIDLGTSKGLCQESWTPTDELIIMGSDHIGFLLSTGHSYTVSGNEVTWTYDESKDIIKKALHQNYHKLGGVIFCGGGRGSCDFRSYVTILPETAKKWREYLQHPHLPWVTDGIPPWAQVSASFKQSSTDAIRSQCMPFYNGLQTKDPQAKAIKVDDVKNIKNAGDQICGKNEQSHYCRAAYKTMAQRYTEAIDGIISSTHAAPRISRDRIKTKRNCTKYALYLKLKNEHAPRGFSLNARALPANGHRPASVHIRADDVVAK